MKKAITLLTATAFLLVAILVVNSVFAAGTGYTVIVSGEDIWFGASNVSGKWKGGGSVCATSMVQPKPPLMPGAILLARITVTGGGPGTFVIPPGFTDTATGEPIPPGKHDFALDGLLTVMYSINPDFPKGRVAPSRATFNLTEGHSDQNVVIWMGVPLGDFVPIRLIHNAHVVINIVG